MGKEEMALLYRHYTWWVSLVKMVLLYFLVALGECLSKRGDSNKSDSSGGDNNGGDRKG
jgi:hypothetical protein